MNYSVVEVVLLVALILTSAIMLSVFTKLRQLQRNHQRLVDQLKIATAALDKAHDAFANMRTNVQDATQELSNKIAEAKALPLQ